MSRIQMKRDAMIDTGYEFYQTIIDFDHPIQIFREAFQNSVDEGATEVYCKIYINKKLDNEDLYIDIYDNGIGLMKENADCFFGLAKSTKVDANKNPIAGKLGYKGHGTKIFFRSERVEICSKNTSGQIWGAILDDAVGQIRNTGNFKYSDLLKKDDLSITFPRDFKSGFFLRIKNPTYFKTQHTRYMLNHMYLRDYSKWYTVFGNIRNEFTLKPEKKRILYLQGLNIDHFKRDYRDDKSIDPVSEFIHSDCDDFEKFEMGHYFPPQRTNDKDMEKYTKKVGLNKPFSHYYSKEIIKDTIYLDNNLHFNFILHVEGYETKRRYDILLSRTGRSSIPKLLMHTDGERYGLWACKGGVPIEKVDDWIIGGRGVGTYTYMHGFIDCDAFELTGTRGSIRNTNLEIIQKIKDKVNEILSEKKIKNDLAERQDWEKHEKTLKSIEEDKEELKKRFKDAQNKKSIYLPNKITVFEPSKLRTGYSESETLILLIELMHYYPKLLPFNILDYNTRNGIDFVIKKAEHPEYVELKGSMKFEINHSFRHIYKFICYDIDLKEGDVVSDIEGLEVELKINKNDKFESQDTRFKGKKHSSFQLYPKSAVFQSMEIIVLKRVILDVIGAKIL